MGIFGVLCIAPRAGHFVRILEAQFFDDEFGVPYVGLIDKSMVHSCDYPVQDFYTLHIFGLVPHDRGLTFELLL